MAARFPQLFFVSRKLRQGFNNCFFLAEKWRESFRNCFFVPADCRNSFDLMLRFKFHSFNRSNIITQTPLGRRKDKENENKSYKMLKYLKKSVD
jgi:hypothetical protein